MTKQISLIACLILSLSSFGTELPKEVDELNKLREKEIAKIEAKYQKALVKIRDKYAKEGKFKEATAVDSKIIKKDEVHEIVGTIWEYRIKGNLKSVFTISPMGVVLSTKGYRGVSWSHNLSGILTIQFEDGNRFPFDKKGNSLGGRTLTKIGNS